MALNDELHEHAKQAHSSIKKYAWEYGENREGYWTCYKLMVQIKQAVNIAEIKYCICSIRAVSTIYFITQFCTASIQERLLIKSGTY